MLKWCRTYWRSAVIDGPKNRSSYTANVSSDQKSLHTTMVKRHSIPGARGMGKPCLNKCCFPVLRYDGFPRALGSDMQTKDSTMACVINISTVAPHMRLSFGYLRTLPRHFCFSLSFPTVFSFSWLVRVCELEGSPIPSHESIGGRFIAKADSNSSEWYCAGHLSIHPKLLLQPSSWKNTRRYLHYDGATAYSYETAWQVSKLDWSVIRLSLNIICRDGEMSLLLFILRPRRQHTHMVKKSS